MAARVAIEKLLSVLLLFSICPLLVASGSEPSSQLVRREVDINDPLWLKEFGIPDVKICFRDNTPSNIYVDITAGGNPMAIAQGPREKGARRKPVGATGLPPYAGKYRIEIEKKDGRVLPGTHSRMYLVFTETTSGTKVYVLDEIASLNKWIAVVEVAPQK